MTSKRVARLAVVLSVAAAAALTGVALTALYLLLSEEVNVKTIPYPSDSEMLSNFESHKAQFDQLLEMMMSDQKAGLHAVWQDRTDPTDPQTIGIGEARIQSYRKLLHELNTPGGIFINLDGSLVEMVAFVDGATSSSKSYEWRKSPPQVPSISVGNIDQAKAKLISSPSFHPLHLYRLLEGDWYLVFDAD